MLSSSAYLTAEALQVLGVGGDGFQPVQLFGHGGTAAETGLCTVIVAVANSLFATNPLDNEESAFSNSLIEAPTSPICDRDSGR